MPVLLIGNDDGMWISIVFQMKCITSSTSRTLPDIPRRKTMNLKILAGQFAILLQLPLYGLVEVFLILRTFLDAVPFGTLQVYGQPGRHEPQASDDD